MPVSNGRITVGTAATIIPKTCVQPWSMEIHNDDNTDAVYIGAVGVTTANGMPLNKLEQLRLDLSPLDYVYAVSTKAGHSMSWVAFTQAC